MDSKEKKKKSMNKNLRRVDPSIFHHTTFIYVSLLSSFRFIVFIINKKTEDKRGDLERRVDLHAVVWRRNPFTEDAQFNKNLVLYVQRGRKKINSFFSEHRKKGGKVSSTTLSKSGGVFNEELTERRVEQRLERCMLGTARIS